MAVTSAPNQPYPRLCHSRAASPRVPLDVILLVIECSDIDVLVAWRRCGAALARHVTRLLRSLFQAIIEHYLPHSTPFIQLLRTHDAVVVDEAALAFFLRDRSLLRHECVVSVLSTQVEAFQEQLRRAYDLRPVSDASTSLIPSAQTTLLSTTRSRYIRLRVVGIHHMNPSLETAVASVAAAPHTGLVNFVGADVFGCAYPALTLRRSAFLRWGWAANNQSDRRAILVLSAQGRFTFSQPSCPVLHSPQPRLPDVITSDPWIGSPYACECAIRHFGDSSSLVDVFHRRDDQDLRLLHAAVDGIPAGIVPGWRWPVRHEACAHRWVPDHPSSEGAFPLECSLACVRVGPMY